MAQKNNARKRVSSKRKFIAFLEGLGFDDAEAMAAHDIEGVREDGQAVRNYMEGYVRSAHELEESCKILQERIDELEGNTDSDTPVETEAEILEGEVVE